MKLPIGPKRRSDAACDVVAFGENSLDTLVLGVGPRGGAKLPVTAIADLPGGQAATVAVACARLGWRARYVGVLGDDAAGHTVRTALMSQHVDVVAVTRTRVATRRAVVLVDDSAHDRSVLECRDDALDLVPGDVPAEVFTDARVLVVDAVDLRGSIAAAASARASGVRTIVDVDRGGPGVAELLSHIDVVIVPELVVAALAGVPGLGRGLAWIGRETGAVVVVATLGAAGALAWSQGREVRAAGHAVDAVDTTGAGDAFRAGFAAAWLGDGGATADLEHMLGDANLVASLNCRRLGAQAGLPTRSEVPLHLRGPV